MLTRVCQIMAALRRIELGLLMPEICRAQHISSATFDNWRAMFRRRGHLHDGAQEGDRRREAQPQEDVSGREVQTRKSLLSNLQKCSMGGSRAGDDQTAITKAWRSYYSAGMRVAHHQLVKGLCTTNHSATTNRAPSLNSILCQRGD